MSTSETLCAICNSFADIWEIVEEMEQEGVALEGLSLVGLSPDSGDHVVGLFHTRGKTSSLGLSSYDIWSHLSDVGLFVVPSKGPVVVAGPLVEILVSTVRTVRKTNHTGGHSLVGAALLELGAKKERLHHFDTAIRAGEVVIAYRGETAEVERVRALLQPRRTVYFERRE
ncbi:MAG: hypothetical protein KC800_26545 [Candidatus Eremiobacteraeota bacterium]|nr:hypothetical protein [Candidatus Eremiobacteraeota bacterium]